MTRYRVCHHSLVDVSGRIYLHLAAENAVFEVDRSVADLIRHFAEQAECDQGSVAAYLEREHGNGGVSFEDLTRQRILTPADKRQPEIVPDRHASIMLDTLVLHVTDACNLGCSYCYHSSLDKVQTPRRVMDPATAEQAVDFLMDRSNGRDAVTLVFFGGEPLLNFRTIEHTVSYAKERAEAVSKTVRFATTTNGTVLTERMGRFLHRNGFSVTVSMDGPEPIHDRHRRFPDGSPSYRSVKGKVRQLLSDPGANPVVARVTVVSDPDQVPRTLDHLLKLGFSEVGFAPVTTTDYRLQLDRPGMDRLLERFHELSQRFLHQALDGRFLGFTNLIDQLVVLHEGEIRQYPCGAGLNMLAVDPEGELFMCQRLTGEPDCRMGSLQEGVDRDRLFEIRKNAHVSRKPVCLECTARAVCAGGCYHEALLREGGLMRPNLHYCDWIRRWLDIGLAVYGRLSAEAPDYLDGLSQLRGHAPVYLKPI